MTAAEVIEELKKTGEIKDKTFDKFLFIDFNGLDAQNIILVVGGVEFINCTFVKAIRLINLILDDRVSVRFTDCTFENEVSCLNFTSKYLKFEKCIFKNQLTLQNINCKTSEISFENNEIGGVFNLNKIESNSLFFSNNMIQFCFINEISSSFFQIIALQEGRNMRELNFGNNAELENLNIEAKNTIHTITINELKNAKLYGDFNRISIQSKEFNNITLSGLSSNSEEKGSIKSLEFKSQNFTGNLTVSNLSIDSLTLRNLLSLNAIFNFTNIVINKITRIENIKISKIHLDVVEFKDQLIIKNSDLSGLKPNNVTWLPNQVISPDNTEREIPWFYRFRKKKTHDESLITELKQQRDAYRQLKVASQNNHNQVEALAFYRNEMRLYWKEIRLVGGEKWYNTFLIFLNRIISDFGQNWVSPLLFLFGVNFILFMCIFNWNFSCDLKDFEYGIGQYFRLLNPVRVTPEYINSGMGIFTDFWMRVLNGFFIYHFLKASRKYGV